MLAAEWDLAHSRAAGASAGAGCQALRAVEDGFCGCLTTVSTWAAELRALAPRHAYVYGAATVAAALAVVVPVMGGLRWSAAYVPLACA